VESATLEWVGGFEVQGIAFDTIVNNDVLWRV